MSTNPPPPPKNPKIYHITHVDNLTSVIADGYLWCGEEARRRSLPGTMIGYKHIRQRRLAIPVKCHPGLKVGGCVPFYLRARSRMLKSIDRAGSDLDYRGGQDPVVHLVADLRETVDWAECNHRLWAFTNDNAGSGRFHDWCDLTQLDEIKWSSAVRNSLQWPVGSCAQAEFLVQHSFSWDLVRRVGVRITETRNMAEEAIRSAVYKPSVEVWPHWYH